MCSPFFNARKQAYAIYNKVKRGRITMLTVDIRHDISSPFNENYMENLQYFNEMIYRLMQHQPMAEISEDGQGFSYKILQFPSVFYIVVQYADITTNYSRFIIARSHDIDDLLNFFYEITADIDINPAYVLNRARELGLA
jgi:hypothetical protein